MGSNGEVDPARPMPAPSPPRPRPPVTSLRPAAGDPEAPLARRSPYGKWRALALVLVYVAIAAHVVHWRLAGRTLAPLELHEVMFTAELGIVTAGFLFMALAVVATGIFGRWFCGWGCHMMALQELCAWLLRKAGLGRKPIRSRLVAWAPFAVMLYMFVWPQLARTWAGRPHPGFRFSDDTAGIASFVTTDFWRNLPGPWITALTFLVCGGLAVYVLGSRGFCAYACPYGVVFRLADRLAPGKVRLVGRCEQCGTCTKVCTSGVRVHEEIARHGFVADPRCMKDLDCVGACPHDAIAFRFGKPALLTRPARSRPDLAAWEELLMAATFLLTLLVFRGLYGRVPFLMSVGLGAVTAYACVVLLRLLVRSEVRLGRQILKDGGLRGAGWAFAAAMALYLAFWGHSAFVHWSAWRGERLYAEARAVPAADAVRRLELADRAFEHAAAAERWGLLPAADLEVLLVWLTAMRGDPAGAEARLRKALALDPQSPTIRYYLAGYLARRGERSQAIEHLREATRLAPDDALTHLRLGQLLLETGEHAAGERHLSESARLSTR